MVMNTQEWKEHLSPKQAQVVDLLIDGHSVRWIAEELLIVPHTVENHIQTAKFKLYKKGYVFEKHYWVRKI